MFPNHEASHAHSLETLNLMYEYDDFMDSISTLADIGCGSGGLDLEWWATRTTRDDDPEPLNIRCMGIDIFSELPMARKYPNITYQKVDFEETIAPPKKLFDVIWCHDAFQYAINPIKTLSRWQKITSDGAMLALTVPQTTNIVYKNHQCIQPNGCYHHHTLVSLIHTLATAGWDCNNGFFLKKPNDHWIHAVVYKSKHPPMDPKKITWYELADLKLLPESAAKSIMKHGYLQQQDLLLTWLDKSISWMGNQ